ncbi:hypothetical protein BGZ65_008368, partial [Modicella reniformis]
MNPFLSSSFDDLKSPSHSFNQHNYESFVYNHTLDTDNSSTIKHPNPFVYDHPPTNSVCPRTDAYIEDPRSDSETNTYSDSITRTTGLQHWQKYEVHYRQKSGARRLSLNLLKTPFGWHRRRRATCASSDLEKMLLFEQSNGYDEGTPRSGAKYDLNGYSQQFQDIGGGELNENIIPTRYRPEEQEQEEGGLNDSREEDQHWQENSAKDDM